MALSVDPGDGRALVEATTSAFGPHGPLAAAATGYRPRAGQVEMACAVAEAIETRGTLVAEAGTGIGKTFAYLVPLLLSGRRAIVSTATKNLQDQLFLRDLPRLATALGLPGRHALLKGRASYLCLHRLGQARQTAGLADRFVLRALAKIESWSQRTGSGDLGELEGLDERSPAIPLVTSTRDNCLGAECPQFGGCHVMRARREAMAADLVVVNHHLLFADVALRETGMAELLPTVDAVVFDEAHQVVETGVQFLGATLGSAQCVDFARDLLAAGLQHARGLKPWQELAAGCELRARELRMLAGDLRAVGDPSRRRWEQAAAEPVFVDAIAALGGRLEAAAEALSAVDDTSPDLTRLAQRARELGGRARAFAQPADDGRVRWLELGGPSLRLVESPLDLCDAMAKMRQSSPKAWIFTSATLGDDAALSWFSGGTGLADATRMRVDSPFDYAGLGRLYLPRRFPRPADAGHAEAVATLAARCAIALDGRTFVLTTTRRAVHAISTALREIVPATIEVLTQGSSSKRALLERFLEGGALLVGSQSFWEGVDVPGDALQCVLIDKLPFPPPDDPLIEARGRQVKARGGDPFVELSLTEAAVSLKQGAGRLIRTETDRGLLAVCDPRMRSMGYGRRLLAALPPMALVDGEDEAIDFLETLAATNESGSRVQNESRAAAAVGDAFSRPL